MTNCSNSGCHSGRGTSPGSRLLCAEARHELFYRLSSEGHVDGCESEKMKGNDEAVEVFLDYERDLDVLARPVTSVQGQDRPMVESSPG